MNHYRTVTYYWEQLNAREDYMRQSARKIYGLIFINRNSEIYRDFHGYSHLVHCARINASYDVIKYNNLLKEAISLYPGYFANRPTANELYRKWYKGKLYIYKLDIQALI